MLHKIKKFKILFSLFFIMFLFFALPVHAQINKAFSDETLGKAGFQAGYETDETTDLIYVIGKIVSTILSLLGVVFLVLLIYGGFLWMTARGNEQQVEKAMATIYMAIIGIIIILGAYAISYFVVYRLSQGVLSNE